MSQQPTQRKSRLIKILREGVAVVQMVFFKELRKKLQQNYPDYEKATLGRICGAITNELFGTPNPDPEYIRFYQNHRAIIEQEMLGLPEILPHLRRYLTDALRIQTLCDDQEGVQQSSALLTAQTFGMLLADREIPLPSNFVTMVRELGKEHQLLIPPSQDLSPEDDQELVH